MDQKKIVVITITDGDYNTPIYGFNYEFNLFIYQ